MFTYTYIHTYIYIYACIHVYIYIHTYIHYLILQNYAYTLAQVRHIFKHSALPAYIRVYMFTYTYIHTLPHPAKSRVHTRTGLPHTQTQCIAGIYQQASMRPRHTHDRSFRPHALHTQYICQ